MRPAGKPSWSSFFFLIGHKHRKPLGSSSLSNGGLSEEQLFHQQEMPVKCMKKIRFFLPKLELFYSSIVSSFANLFLSFVFSTTVETAGKYTMFSILFTCMPHYPYSRILPLPAGFREKLKKLSLK